MFRAAAQALRSCCMRTVIDPCISSHDVEKRALFSRSSENSKELRREETRSDSGGCRSRNRSNPLKSTADFLFGQENALEIASLFFRNLADRSPVQSGSSVSPDFCAPM